jgi:hypothetical protein
MSFNYANVKTCQEESRRRGALRSPGEESLSSAELGVSGGEIGGSVGGCGFLDAR